ncbi:MAG TPA: CRISPR-associated protein Cas4 [Anaeromyxobacter sp.]
MRSDDDLIPISALQHLLFCERQCALIHVEGLWAENRLTAEGRVLHEAADRGAPSERDGTTVARDVALRSDRLGLYGRADVVEFRAEAESGRVAFPVEYKRGRRAPRAADEVQLCAQAMCLEEMLGTPVPRGAIFHGASRRRRPVEFTPTLRDLVERSIERLRRLLEIGRTPRAEPGPKCRSCSLAALCVPSATVDPDAASRYLAQLVREGP